MQPPQSGNPLFKGWMGGKQAHHAAAGEGVYNEHMPEWPANLAPVASAKYSRDREMAI